MERCVIRVIIHGITNLIIFIWMGIYAYFYSFSAIPIWAWIVAFFTTGAAIKAGQVWREEIRNRVTPNPKEKP